MLKKLISIIAAMIICLSFTACSDSRRYDEVQTAQKKTLDLNSCRITIITDKEEESRQNKFKTEFSFKTTESGNHEYCQVQFDMADKPVYCEYSDGAMSEQWVLGKGWSRLEHVPSNKKNPHRFLKLISTPFDKKLLSEIKAEESGENRRYVISLNPDRLNEKLYKKENFEVITETLIIVLNRDGRILCYNDIANIRDKETGKDKLYKLDMMLSDYDNVKEIKKPEF